MLPSEFSNWYRASSESAHRQRNTKILGSNGLSYDHVINKLQVRSPHLLLLLTARRASFKNLATRERISGQ